MSRPQALTRRQFWISLGILVLLFVGVAGPVWRNPWDVDLSILASYAPIPFVVAGLLLWNQAFSTKSFLLETAVLACAKFMVTASILIAIWTVSAGPPKLGQAFAPSAAQPAPRVERVLPAPSPLGETRTIAGEVVDGDGKPLSGAFVYVVSGLEALTFAPAPVALSLVNDGTGFAPRHGVVSRGAKVAIQSADQRLHTLRAVWANGTWLRNVPVLGSGAAAGLEVAEGGDWLNLRCTVHADEPGSSLKVIHAPYIARTDSSGRFTLPGVPALPVRLEAASPLATASVVHVDVAAEAPPAVRLVLPSGS